MLTEHISAFGEAIRHARGKKPFHVDAWVVLPSHTHTIWTLPPGDTDCASRWRAVKIAFSKALSKSNAANSSDGAIWARHYQHHAIVNDAEYVSLVHYIHQNPVRHGYCEQQQDWPWSSVHRLIAAGLLPPSRAASAATSASLACGGR